MAETNDYGPDLARMCRRFEEAESSTKDARDKAQRDRDYYDEKQWTSAEEATLKKRKQPVITFNRIKRKVNSLTGLEKQTRKDPKAFPRNPDDEQAANAATDSIRYVCEDSRWDDKRSECAKELLIEGTCAVMVGVKKAKAGIDPTIIRIPWDRYFWDPHASEFDFADKSYDGIVIWKDLDEALRLYPEAKEALEQTWGSARNDETYDDKPKFNLWADYARKRVRIVEMYYKENGWKFCLFTKGGFLVPPMDSPYIDENGEPENPIKSVSLYVDRDNNRYGEVRTMIGPQDEINKRRSKALHLINQRQVRVSRGTGQDADAIRAELAKPDGLLLGEAGEVEVLPTNDMAQANLTLLQEAKTEIDLLGPNAALAGKNQADQSGRAIIAQQQGGMLEATTYYDRIRVLSLAVYRAIWCRVRQYWTAERWIRVTDSEQNLRFVGLNRPVTMIEDATEKMGVTKENIQQMAQQNPQAIQQLSALAQSPQGQMVIRIDNAVGELDVDILVDEGIDTPTIAAEQFDIVAKMLPSAPVNIQPALWEILISSSAFRDKDKLLEKLNQPPSQEQQAAQQLQMRGGAAEVAEKEASAALKGAQAENETMKPVIEGMKAGQGARQAA